MLRREISAFVFALVVIIALIIAATIIWRKTGGQREIILEKAEKPYPGIPIVKPRK